MEKENKVSCDLEKSKIEVVRDALKDAIDTIRAQDRKASCMGYTCRKYKSFHGAPPALIQNVLRGYAA